MQIFGRFKLEKETARLSHRPPFLIDDRDGFGDYCYYYIDWEAWLVGGYIGGRPYSGPIVHTSVTARRDVGFLAYGELLHILPTGTPSGVRNGGYIWPFAADCNSIQLWGVERQERSH